MKKIIKKSVVLVLLAAAVTRAYALDGSAGSAGLQVLKIGIGARSMAMGGAFSAVSDDVTSIYHNPAGLSCLDGAQVSLQHLVYFEDIQYANVSAARPFEFGTIGVSLSHLWMDSIEGRENETSAVTKFDAKDSVAALAYSRMVGEVSAGISLKVISSEIEEASLTGLASDLGLMATPVDRLTAALVIQNLGTNLKYDGDDVGEKEEKLPQNIKLGASYKLTEMMNLAADINMPNDNRANLNVGAEYGLSVGMLSIPVRLGYKTLNDFEAIDGLSAGFGVTHKQISTDFAWIPYGELGDTFRISLLYGF
ncbi:MAG: PorV/PorQ family protein [Elusimicrobia bacterium]|nr:PorV/PorQ family protein [Elusimicrobiota bacterium]